MRISNLDRMKLKYIPVEAGWNLKDIKSTTEITETRQLIGQLNSLLFNGISAFLGYLMLNLSF